MSNDILARAEALGVEFSATPPGSMGALADAVRLTAVQVSRLVELGAREFWPEHLGTTREVMDQYVGFMEGASEGSVLCCTGKNRRGKACRTVIDPYQVPPPPDFRPGKHDRCPWHREE